MASGLERWLCIALFVANSDSIGGVNVLCWPENQVNRFPIAWLNNEDFVNHMAAL